MQAIPAHNENERLKRLWYLKMIDLHPPEGLRNILRTMNCIFKPHIALLSIIDKDFQKSCYASGEPLVIDRKDTICSHVILKPKRKVFIVNNISNDWRFANNPKMVDYNVQFYAGVPLIVNFHGVPFAIGTLCLYSDTATTLSDEKKDLLIIMGDLAMSEIYLWMESRQLLESKAKLRSLSDFTETALSRPSVYVFACEKIKQVLDVVSVDFTLVKPIEIEGTILDWERPQFFFDGSKGGSGMVCTVYNDILKIDILGYLVVYTDQERRVFDDSDLDYLIQFSTVLTCFAQQKLVTLANSAKTHFMSSISHELRTPLCGVLSISELLLEGDLPSTQKSLVEIIESSGKNLIGIVNNLLDFSKNESKSIQVNKTKVNLPQFIQETLDAFSYNLSDSVEILCVNIKCNAIVDLDQTNVRQVLQNLLSNAIKFTSDGSVTLRCHLDNDNLIFQVIDTGKGISPDFKPNLFLPFHKENEFTQGVGLGLSLCLRLSKALGGKVFLKRSSPQGSVFQFELPVSFSIIKPNLTNWDYSWFTKASQFTGTVDHHLSSFLEKQGGSKRVILIEDSPKMNYSFSFEPTSFYVIFASVPRLALVSQGIPLKKNLLMFSKPVSSGKLINVIKEIDDLYLKLKTSPNITKNIRALVIDDSSTNRTILSMFLRKRNFYHEVANDGDVGFEKYKNGSFNLVLTDMQMPKMNGLETIELIRKYEKANTLLPAFIVMLTGLGTDFDREISYKAGADSFYVKPFTLKQIDQVINDVFS